MGGEGMGMLGGAHRMERMLALVNASPEQRAKVHEIMKATHQDLQKLHEAGRGLHQQMAQLMAAPKVDTAAVEAARQRMLAQHDAVSKRMTQAMLDAGAVLTPEQREKIGARMAMMERHRKEREALDPPRRN
jgi:Spy/CpxP family protein refolding chaperone